MLCSAGFSSGIRYPKPSLQLMPRFRVSYELEERMSNKTIEIAGSGLREATWADFGFAGESAEIAGRYGLAGTALETKVLIDPPIETEMRYFVPLSKLAESGLIEGVEPVRILQHYFPKSGVAGLVSQFGLNERFDRTDELSSARLRRSEGPAGTVFSIDFKSRKFEGAGGRISRIEISIPLSFEEYCSRLGNATSGTLEKLRYSIQGSVTMPGGDELALKAEVDLVCRAGNKGKRVDPSFALVDIELPDGQIALRMREGKHSFEILKSGALELIQAPAELAEVLSTKRMAKHGLGRDERQAIGKLRELCEAAA